MPEQEQFLDLHFPKAGVHVAGPFGKQPARQGRNDEYVRTSADAENVLGFDPATDRDRGGLRAGLSKYVAQLLPTEEWVVQHLAALAATNGSVTSLQQSTSGRIVYLVAVSQGVVKVATPGDTTWTATTNNTGETPPLNFTGVMQSTALNQKLYFVDGVNYAYYNPPTNAVEAWTASTAGTLPVDGDSNTARICCTWRGRLCLSGVLGDPQNIFMSAVGDAHDFNYLTPVPVPVTSAVALSTSPLGVIGDVVTGLVPYTDDVLIVGGDHTIYRINGDPLDGGRSDLVSDITGMAFGQAWCKDPYGNVYFFGNKPSVWRMSGSSKPEKLSQPIEPRLKDIDTGRSIILLVWDEEQQCVHVYVTADDEPTATTHYTWDYRANAWWPVVFADTDHNPLCCVAYDGNEADDRAVLLGGWDGYVRAVDVDATTDDGETIASYVLVGPIMTQTLDTMLLKDIQFVLGEQSGDVTYEVLAADTPESALAAAARASGTASAGRNPTQPIRVADHAIYIKISATTRWAFESMRARFSGRGKVRRRKS